MLIERERERSSAQSEVKKKKSQPLGQRHARGSGAVSIERTNQSISAHGQGSSCALLVISIAQLMPIGVVRTTYNNPLHLKSIVIGALVGLGKFLIGKKSATTCAQYSLCSCQSAEIAGLKRSNTTRSALKFPRAADRLHPHRCSPAPERRP